MCGIAGVTGAPGQADLDLCEPASAMCAALEHRGPDDGGVWLAAYGRVAFANRRLAIRDLSAAGHMPMSTADGTIWITYNGEIYNSDELRSELEARGFGFRSKSDTEVILLGYVAWGETVVSRLRGMFALAIYDARQAPTLLLARDPLGIKPLYYTRVGGRFAFASECRALIAGGLATSEISPNGLLAYLQLGSVPAPLTIYRDIQAMEAGHQLTVTWDAEMSPRIHSPRAYWSLPVASASPPQVPYSTRLEELRALLTDSVRRHLVSDVPLGAFLSGGVDSASVVGLMRATSTSVIRTCSVVFNEGEYSEASYARQVAERFETEHVEVPITAADLQRELEPVLAAMDQPSNDGVNTYFVSQAARAAGLTVALSGLGGDELFGGYPTFQRLPRILRMARWAELVPGALKASGAAMDLQGRHHPMSRLGGWLPAGGADPAAVYLGMRGLFSRAALGDLVRPELLRVVPRAQDALLDTVRDSAHNSRDTNDWTAVSRMELTSYMRHQLLRDTDVMSMAHSLEVRVPLVDHHVVERVLALDLRPEPGHLPKQILRDVVPTVPDTVRLRRDKQGFSFPFQPWMLGPLRPRLGELVATAERHLADYIQPGAGQRLLAEFDAGKLHWSRVWALAAMCTTVGVRARIAAI